MQGVRCLLKKFHRQTVARKLAVAALVLLGPAAILGAFMESGFRYDLRIGRTELAGTRYLRPAFELLHAVSEHQTARLVQRADAPTVPAEGTVLLTPQELAAEQRAPASIPPVPKSRLMTVEHTLGLLEQTVRNEAARFRSSPSFLPEDEQRMNPELLRHAWEAILTSEDLEAYDDMFMILLQAMSAVSDCANLALDPALDSHALATAIALNLPRASVLLSELERMALELHSHGVSLSPGQADPGLLQRRDRILRRIGLLRDGLVAEVTSNARRAVLEDPNFYGVIPELEKNLLPVLARFEEETRRAVESMQDLCHGRGDPARAALLVRQARIALTDLAMTGLTRLDLMVQQRMDVLQQRRLAAVLSGIAATALALSILMLIWRHLSSSISRGLEYVHRVAEGDYSARVDDADFGHDLAAYTNGVRQMVGTLKQQIGLLDGVLRNMTVPCLVVDAEERLTFINRPYLDLFEMDKEAEDYLGLTLNQFFYDGKSVNTILGKAMQEGNAQKGLQMSLLSVGGRPLTVRYDVAPLHDLDGTLIGGFAMFVDLTEIHEQQQEIERLAAFPRENPNPLFSTDAQGVILFMNPAEAKAIEDLRIGPEGLLPSNHADIVRAVVSTRSSRLDVESRPGDRIYSWAYHPVPHQKQAYVYGLDITLRRRMEEQLTHDALHDGLTGLPNRSLFLDRVEQALGRARRNPDARFAILFLDLDRFKNINDSLGHAAGDELLLQFSERLGSLLNEEDTLARLGGDEFVILLEHLAGADRALALADKVHQGMSRPFQVQEHELFITASVGLVVGPEDNVGPQDLLRNADTAMYRAKAEGRARSAVYDQAMHNEARERLSLEMDMQRGLENGEFEPYYQPLINIADGQLHGFEALARWNHPTRGLVSPGMFIPIAEETGLIAVLGRRMLELSMQRLAAWRRELPPNSPLSMSVNLSPEQMGREDVLQELQDVLQRHDLTPELLKIEITESGVMSNPKCALRLLKNISAHGILLAVDDFGTGYSSLSHLSRFPFDFIKIDQSFVRGMLTSRQDMEIVRSVVALAHGLEKKIIAEGIEEPEQLMALQQMGCHFGQGYLFSPPVPAAKARMMLFRTSPWY